MTPRRLDALTGLRFFAAAWVLLYHYRKHVTFPAVVVPLIEQGRAGVSLFFVLSGFVLYYSYHQHFDGRVPGAHFWQFARARFARIVPMHVLALLLVTPATLWLVRNQRPFAESYLRAQLDGFALLRTWLANLALVQMYKPSMLSQEAWNGPSWSIGDELVFYALFPVFAAVVLSRLSTTRALVKLAAGLLVLEAGCCLLMLFVVADLDPANPGDTADFIVCRLPFVRIWEFFLGCTLAAIYLRQGDKLACRRNLLLGLALGGSAAVALLPGLLQPLRWYVLYTPFFALLIAGLAAGPTFLSPLLEHRWVLLLGESSYALYITQAAPLHLLWPNTQAGMWPSVALVATILCSIPLHRLFERPMRRLLTT